MGCFDSQDKVQTILGYTCVVEQLLFSRFPSNLTFDFDLLLLLSITSGKGQ